MLEWSGRTARARASMRLFPRLCPTCRSSCELASLSRKEAERLAREEARLAQEEVHLHGRLAELKARPGPARPGCWSW